MLKLSVSQRDLLEFEALYFLCLHNESDQLTLILKYENIYDIFVAHILADKNPVIIDDSYFYTVYSNKDKSNFVESSIQKELYVAVYEVFLNTGVYEI